MINILFVGDVIGQPGCNYLRKVLPGLKSKYAVDVAIVNGENSAVGNGILPSSAEHIFASGADVITTGNHAFRRREIYQYFDETQGIIRPVNFPECCNGRGYYIYDAGRYRLCVINLMGTVFMENLENPFYCIDKVLNSVDADFYFVDFHAEATGEKKAMGYYLDGRVSAVIGTHTHIQTADEQILPEGTGYLTDVGMTGPVNSVLGVDAKNIIQRYLTSMPTRFEVPNTNCSINAVLLEIDESNGKCTKIKRIISI